MSQGITIKGKTASGQSVEILVDDLGQLLVVGASGGGLQGFRQDADTVYPGVANGQAHPLLFNELGRLKTASASAQFSPVDMAVSAIQATAGTPVANATAFANVEQVSNVMAYVTGTFAAMNCTFEGSLDSTNGTDGTWFTIQAVRSNANTIETATGNLSAAPVYAWELSVNALSWFRVRCTARTSGTQNWKFRLGSFATEPIPAAQISGTQPVSGTVTITHPTPTALNFNAAAGNNLTVVKASAGTLYGIKMHNRSAGLLYVKLYNKATAPVLASDVPVMVIPIAAGALLDLDFSIVGHRFATGIGLATTGGVADTDATAVVASDLRGLIQFI